MQRGEPFGVQVLVQRVELLSVDGAAAIAVVDLEYFGRVQRDVELVLVREALVLSWNCKATRE